MPASDLRNLGLSLAQKILTRLSEALATEFPTSVPQTLGNIMHKLVQSVTSLLKSSNDERILKYACQYLQEISSHLRYIEGASSLRIPASLITTMETFIKQIEPTARVMIRVQSSYNYQIFDIVDLYRRMYTHLLGGNLPQVLGTTDQLHVVAVPAVEHSNILLHTILAHEAGHRIAHKYLDTEDKQALVVKINDLMSTDLKWYDSDFEKLPPLWKLQLRQSIFDLIHRARTSALQELISDAVAYYLCGASALFALDEFSSIHFLDAAPEERYDFYPPWRYRLRRLVSIAYSENILTAVERISGNPPLPRIRDSVRERLILLKSLTDQTPDLTVLEQDGILKRAYSDVPAILDSMEAFILNEIAGLRYTPAKLTDEISVLLQRLSLGIPPDDIERDLPDIRSVLASGWFYKSARIPIPYNDTADWQPKNDDTLTRLVSKAIESIYLTRDFRSRNAQG
ncbi:MAG: hypothetical protein V3T23_06700 [Nitrososphaerales archaeon]